MEMNRRQFMQLGAAVGAAASLSAREAIAKGVWNWPKAQVASMQPQMKYSGEFDVIDVQVDVKAGGIVSQRIGLIARSALRSDSIVRAEIGITKMLAVNVGQRVTLKMAWAGCDDDGIIAAANVKTSIECSSGDKCDDGIAEIMVRHELHMDAHP